MSMEAYKFETIVQENGVIQIPEIAKFAHQQIEVFIVVKLDSLSETKKQQPIDHFLDKWKGVLKGVNPDELKTQYLQEKYG